MLKINTNTKTPKSLNKDRIKISDFPLSQTPIWFSSKESSTYLVQKLRSGYVAKYLFKDKELQLAFGCKPQAIQQQTLVSSPQIHVYYLCNGPVMVECDTWLSRSNEFMEPLKIEITSNQAPRG